MDGLDIVYPISELSANFKKAYAARMHQTSASEEERLLALLSDVTRFLMTRYIQNLHIYTDKERYASISHLRILDAIENAATAGIKESNESDDALAFHRLLEPDASVLKGLDSDARRHILRKSRP